MTPKHNITDIRIERCNNRNGKLHCEDAKVEKPIFGSSRKRGDCRVCAGKDAWMLRFPADKVDGS